MCLENDSIDIDYIRKVFNILATYFDDALLEVLNVCQITIMHNQEKLAICAKHIDRR